MSKLKKVGTSTPQPGATSTPVITASIVQPISPSSPTRHSRLQEKAELQNLNDRLACYIDRVRNLETENSRLCIEVQTTKDTVSRETSNIKSMYESELFDARKLLDDTSRERAKLEIDVKRLWEQNEDLKARLDKRTKEHSQSENSARLYETRCSELKTKYSNVLAVKEKAIEEKNELQQELQRCCKQLDEVRKNLEDETLARIDLENNIQSLREELTFRDQIHSQELSESRNRRQVEISEIDGRLSEQYEAKLQQSLQELRDQYEGQMRVNRDSIEMLYENKIKALQNATNRNANTSAKAIEELHSSRSHIESLNLRVTELESTNVALNARLRDIQKLMDDERTRHAAETVNLEAELTRMREEMAQQVQEYQDLMDIKVSLDLEIAAYDKLLCGEESRLNITTSGTTVNVNSISQLMRSTRKTPNRQFISSCAGTKRKRAIGEKCDEQSESEYFVTNTSQGDVQISKCDSDGKFIELRNKSNTEVNVGGWQLICTAGEKEISYKFYRTVKIDSNATVTIWSTDAGITHQPPFHIVMKAQKWFVADNIKTVLINGEKEEVAVFERVKRTLANHTVRYRLSSRPHISGRACGAIKPNEDLYYQLEEPQSEDKCCLM